MKNRNLIGSQVRKLRYQRHMTQEELASKLQVAGYDQTRGTLAKVEAKLQWVGDFELFYYTKSLRCSIYCKCFFSVTSLSASKSFAADDRKHLVLLGFIYIGVSKHQDKTERKTRLESSRSF